MNPRTLRLIALGYVVKTALVGLAWLAVPDLPERAMDIARQTWTRVTFSPASPASPTAPAAPAKP
jgi:hypothetical protein